MPQATQKNSRIPASLIVKRAERPVVTGWLRQPDEQPKELELKQLIFLILTIIPSIASAQLLGIGTPVPASAPYIDTRLKPSFSLSCSAAAASGQEVWVTNTQTIGQSMTCSAPVRVLPGGMIATATTTTVTFTSGFDSGGARQVFSGSGSIVFGYATGVTVYPEMWGITGTADQVAINKAIQSLPQFIKTYRFGTAGQVILTGTYNADGAIDFTGKNNIVLSSKGASIFYTGSGSLFKFAGGSSYNKILGYPAIVYNNNSSTVHIFDFDYSYFNYIEAEVAYTAFAPGGGDSKVVYMRDASGISGNIYGNTLNILSHYAGWSAYLDGSQGDIITSNEFNIWQFASTNGIHLSYANNNKFKFIDFELNSDVTQTAFEFINSSTNNVVEIDRIETHIGSFDTTRPFYRFDSTSVNNTFTFAQSIYTSKTTTDPLVGNLIWNLQIPQTQNVIYAGDDYETQRQVSYDKIYSGPVTTRNYIKFSEDFTQWGTSNALVTASSTTAPNNLGLASKITSSTSSGFIDNTSLAVSNADIAGTQWTFSVWLKADQEQRTRLELLTNGTGSVPYIINLFTVGTEWRRYKITGTFSSNCTGTQIQAEIWPVYNNTGTVYAWGAMLYKGDYFAGYLPYAKGTEIRPDEVGVAFSQGIFTRNIMLGSDTLDAGYKRLRYCSSIPTTGTHEAGDICLNSGGSGGSIVGWKCISAGSPGTWFPVGFISVMGADVGDSDTTATVGTTGTTIRYESAITATRTVTLSTTGATNGSKFRIVRRATATGAFNVNCGTGPLKALATPGSFCDVEYTGAAWILTGYGVL